MARPAWCGSTLLCTLVVFTLVYSQKPEMWTDFLKYRLHKELVQVLYCYSEFKAISHKIILLKKIFFHGGEVVLSSSIIFYGSCVTALRLMCKIFTCPSHCLHLRSDVFWKLFPCPWLQETCQGQSLLSPFPFHWSAVASCSSFPLSQGTYKAMINSNVSFKITCSN